MSAACTLCRMRISAGHAMHREPHALDVERDRARRQIGLALGLEAVAGRGAGDVEVGQRDLLVAADHHAVVETAVGGGHAGVTAGEVEDVVAQGRWPSAFTA